MGKKSTFSFVAIVLSIGVLILVTSVGDRVYTTDQINPAQTQLVVAPVGVISQVVPSSKEVLHHERGKLSAGSKSKKNR